MKKLVVKVVFLLISFLIVVGGYWKFATYVGIKYYGLSTEQQIRKSFKNAVSKEYDCYLLGNSRIYRGVNPEYLTNVNAYNFGHDNDSYNQMYYKLEYLIKRGLRINTLIIGTDYFQFSEMSDTRNYIYNKLLSKDYQNDYEQTVTDSIENQIVTQWVSKRLLWPDCIKCIKGVEAPEYLPYQRENGQYIAQGQASPEDSVERKHEILDIQYEYYERIVDLCENNDIMLYVLMPPARDEELSSYSLEDMEYIDYMIIAGLRDRYRNNYYNCSRLPGLTDYTNYIDITHLNEEAANRFSEYINQVILGDTSEVVSDF